MQDEDLSTQQLDWLTPSSPTECLSTGFPDKMVILDCETTGGKATFHRITEIGLLIVEQGKIVERWQQLINPEAHIPPEIQRLTGITPDMVRDAPTFADIAAALMQRLEGYVVVAHNARFDYGFLKNEFARTDTAYSTSPLCSVKLSRRLYPQYKSHSLSAIIKRFDFSIENRHRALDDAQMVWQLFLKASNEFDNDTIHAACSHVLKRPALPMQLDAAEIDRLPKSPGVYYFYDAHGKLLYIGKSINIRERVMSHFTQDYRNAKDLTMSALIAHIDFEHTPSDFGAQIRESQQIKILYPYYNRRLRKTTKLYQFEKTTDPSGYLRIHIATTEHTGESANSEQFGLFRSRKQAEARLVKLVEHFFLCQKLCGLQTTGRSKQTPCFGFQLKRCFGACCQQEPYEAYNERVHIALKEYQQKVWPWPDAILVEERSQDDTQNPAWHLLDNWRHLAKIQQPDELYDYGYQLATPGDKNQETNCNNDTLPGKTDGAVNFDLDLYLILIRFLLSPKLMQQNHLRVLKLRRITSE